MFSDGFAEISMLELLELKNVPISFSIALIQAIIAVYAQFFLQKRRSYFLMNRDCYEKLPPRGGPKMLKLESFKT